MEMLVINWISGTFVVFRERRNTEGQLTWSSLVAVFRSLDEAEAFITNNGR